ncbi:MAG: GldM family protein [Chitinophagales bacterium]
MAGGKLSPRQKMINMMYLVLTALLAMNVSKEVLLAFRSIEVGIENSNEVVVDKLEFLNTTLGDVAAKDATAKGLLDLSAEVSNESQSLLAFISEVKTTLLSDDYAGEDGDNPGQVANLSDIDSPTRLLADKEKAGFVGLDLQNKINDTRANFLAILAKVDGITPEEIAVVEKSFTLNAEDFEKSADRTQTEWYSQFFQVPAPGAMTLLTKIENDALNTEAVIAEYLLNRVSATKFKFDELRATVQAEKAYLPGGSMYTSNIFLTASSSEIKDLTYIGKLDWDLFVNEDTSKTGLGKYVTENEDDNPFVGEFEEVVEGMYERMTSVGKSEYEGAIKIKSPTGNGYDWYPFKSSYEGAAPGGFSAALDKMNVLYIGVPNPMTITIGDAKPGSERVSMSGGGASVSGSGNSWVANVTTVTDQVTLSASGTTPDGTSTSSYNATFRVKRIPDPVPSLGGVLFGGSNVPGGTLRAQQGVVAKLDNFPYDARFDVISYDFILSTQGEILAARGNSGALISGQVSNLIQRAVPNDYVIFENIKVKGPDGQSRKIGSISLKVI